MHEIVFRDIQPHAPDDFRFSVPSGGQTGQANILVEIDKNDIYIPLDEETFYSGNGHRVEITGDVNRVDVDSVIDETLAELLFQDLEEE